MLPLLDRGFSEVVWMDSDLLVNGSIRSVLDGIPRDELVITQDSPASGVGEYNHGKPHGRGAGRHTGGFP